MIFLAQPAPGRECVSVRLPGQNLRMDKDFSCFLCRAAAVPCWRACPGGTMIGNSVWRPLHPRLCTADASHQPACRSGTTETGCRARTGGSLSVGRPLGALTGSSCGDYRPVSDLGRSVDPWQVVDHGNAEPGSSLCRRLLERAAAWASRWPCAQHHLVPCWDPLDRVALLHPAPAHRRVDESAAPGRRGRGGAGGRRRRRARAFQHGARESAARRSARLLMVNWQERHAVLAGAVVVRVEGAVPPRRLASGIYGGRSGSS